ncbi:MAG: Hsp70 family protein, partial [Spirochaetaceae bacterium]|nr:Hsp70 family protein [Spirochaetaceae bacterium]
GLKLANGEFYPVLEEGAVARKRLVVTTVQDGQRSVQIDLYRGTPPRTEATGYVGSLVIENIPLAPRGEPDIRLDLGLDADGTLSAFAENAASGERQSLKVSLESLAEEEKYEIPDFEFEEETPDELPSETDSFSAAEEPARSGTVRAPASRSAGFGAEARRPEPAARPETAEGGEKPRRRGLFVALVVFAAIVVALGLAFLVYSLSMSSRGAAVIAEEPAPAATAPAAPAPAAPTPAPAAPAPAPTPAPAAAVATPAPAPAPAPAAPKPAAAATPAPSPQPAAKEPGVNYKLRWGDTLWDLAYAYYRNPWLYPKIAKANKIKDPDYIIAGRTIFIPPK